MDLAKVGDKVACSCKGGPHRIVSGASTTEVDGIPIPPRRLKLVLTSGYFFSSGSGQLAPGTTELTFEIEVEPL